MVDYKDLQIDDVIVIARKAGAKIMSYRGAVTPEHKDDGSPVTQADKEASRIIVDGLQAVTPHIPVVSEEAPHADNLKAMQEPVRWVTDPLDGTKTFLHGHDGFGVHIALIDNDEAVKGVIYFPAKDELYYTGDDGHAYKQQGTEEARRIQVSCNFNGRDLRAAVHHKKDWQPRDICGHFYDAVCGVGGGRICLVAEGRADISWMSREGAEWAYSHWDIAASHAVLKAAGGTFLDIKTRREVTYGNDNFGVPNAVAGHRGLLDKIMPPADAGHKGRKNEGRAPKH